MEIPGDVTRRVLLRDMALGTVALAAGVENIFGRNASAPPNIVFMMADDLGYADVSCYGRPDLETPNIDSLAAKGVRFLQAYANSAVCSATRTALITGRYQYRLPLGLEEPLVGRAVGLPPDHPTLPSLLKKAGYNTSENGIWACSRNTALSKADTIISTDFAEALLTITPTLAKKTIFGTTTCRCTKRAT